MSRNERILAVAFLCVLGTCATAINALATNQSHQRFDDLGGKAQTAQKNAAAVSARLAEMRETIADLERRGGLRANPEAQPDQALDAIAVGERANHTLARHGIQVIRYGVGAGKTRSITYAIQAEPSDFFAFIQEFDSSNGSWRVTKCDIKVMKDSPEIEGQFTIENVQR